jgi:uncharacterized membrane protein YdjX (TVP38/TMEM64 family)
MSSNLAKRLVLLGLVLGLIILTLMFDLTRYLSFEALQQHEASLRSTADNNPLATALIYIACYAIVVALSLPGAVWMTLTGGFLFGTLIGGFLAVLGATSGAIILFLLARYVIGDVFRSRYGRRLAAFEAGFNRNAFSYLLSMRLVPVFPFFLVNLAAALLHVSLRVFFITTFLGIIPGALVFASIGNGVGYIIQSGSEPDLSLATQPVVILPLIGLAVLTLVPVLLRRWRREKSETI